jgi:hypothetical protein
MADNVVLNLGAGGPTAAADNISNVMFQRVKLTMGIDGVNDGDVSSSNPMPVNFSAGSTAANQASAITWLSTINTTLGGLSTINTTLGGLATASGQTTTNSSLTTINTTLGGLATINTTLGGGLPSNLGGHGGLVIEGVASGTPVPVSVGNTVQISQSAIDNTSLDSLTVTSAGTGTAYNTDGYGAISFSFAGAWTGAIIIQGSNDGTRYFPLWVRDASSDQTTDVITGPGIYLCSPSTFYIQYNVTQITGSINLTVIGKINQCPTVPMAFAQSVDPATGVQVQANIAGGIGRDANNNLIVSDAPLQLNLSGAIGTNIIIDTLGYQSLHITTQALAGSFTSSNDKITWTTLTGTATGLTTYVTNTAANQSTALPCLARYIRITLTAAGTATAFLRNQPWNANYTTTVPTATANNNIASWNGTALVNAGVAGIPAVGGNIAAGVAPTANPILVGGIDTSGLTRRVLTDTSGRVIVDGLGSDNTYRPVGQTPPAAGFLNVPAIAAQFADISDGQSIPDLLSQMLLELRIQSLYLFNLPENIAAMLNSPIPPLSKDDPVYYRNNPNDLI